MLRSKYNQLERRKVDCFSHRDLVEEVDTVLHKAI